ncbi:acyl-CoA N-acyltransferase [Gloeopeniophorella convolvens]|nr:acyl-CoA N-acyltransferase [Gloeopeniophorella convolvens]
MPFQTERTILRAPKPSDNDLILELYNDLEIQSFTFTEYIVPRLDRWAKDYISSFETKPGFIAMVEDKETHAFMGIISMPVTDTKNRVGQLGVALKKEWQGKGFGTEIVRWLVNHAFAKLALHRVSLYVLEGNDAALAVYKKIGFVEEGRARKYNWDGERWWDLILMAILDEEWDTAKVGTRQE